MSGNVRVNKVLYLLIIFFFGTFGVHKFYIGKIKVGLLYLIFAFTCIPTVIVIYEFIMVLTQAPDSDGNVSV